MSACDHLGTCPTPLQLVQRDRDQLREKVESVRDLLTITHCVASSAAARESKCDRRYRCWWCALTNIVEPTA